MSKKISNNNNNNNNNMKRKLMKMKTFNHCKNKLFWVPLKPAPKSELPPKNVLPPKKKPPPRNPKAPPKPAPKSGLPQKNLRSPNPARGSVLPPRIWDLQLAMAAHIIITGKSLQNSQFGPIEEFKEC